MSNFTEDYKRSTTYLQQTNKSASNIKRFIKESLIPYIKGLQQDNPDVKPEDFMSLLEADSYKLAVTAFESTYSLDYYMHYIVCEYLQKNPAIIDNLQTTYYMENWDSQEKYFSQSVNHSFDDYLKRFMCNVMPAYEEELNFFEDLKKANPEFEFAFNCGKKSKELDLYIKDIQNPIHRKMLIKHINYTNGLANFLPDYKSNTIVSILTNTLATSISEIAKQLKRFNLLEKYSTTESVKYKELGLSELSLANQKFDLTNPELLKRMSIHELMILNSFWINRYAKELNNYCSSILSIHDLSLLPKILDNTITSSDINEKHISEVLIKCAMLRFRSQHYMDKMYERYLSDKLPEDEYTVPEDGNFIIYSFDPFAKSMKNRYEEEYDEHFKSLPGHTSLEYDAKLYGKLISPEINIYSTKSEILNGLIYNLDNNRDIINAGIIPDSISKDGTEIYLNPNFICLGLDTKLTFPVREHIKLSVLKDFLGALQDDNNIFVPLYDGYNDFTYNNGDIITAQQVLPTTKDFEKTVRKLALANPSSDLINHLYWLINPSKTPEKYKAKETNSKGKTKKSYVRRYVNLSEYELDKHLQIYVFRDNKYITMQESGLTFSDLDGIVPGDSDGEIVV